MARFVISDIHGAYKALLQCFERSGFDPDKDLLICLGDVCDGYEEVKSCFDELLSVKNLIYIIGNHDLWCYKWAKYGEKPFIWLEQGGYATLKSYHGAFDKNHLELLENSKYYHIIDNMMFVHGGFDINTTLDKHSNDIFIWDRRLVFEAYSEHKNKEKISAYDKVFVGHTPTIKFNHFCPVKFCEVTLTDTGAGWGQKLSIINIDSGQFFQSDPTAKIYQNMPGR